MSDLSFRDGGASAAVLPGASPATAVSRALDWDYTRLADSYVQRPSYADAAIDWLLATAGPGAKRAAIDLGAGTGHLTAPLAERGCNVLALEPNDAMRRHGVARTRAYPNVRWIVGRMEDTRPAGGRVLASDLRLLLRRRRPGGDLPRGGAHPRAARLVRLHVEPSRPRRSAAEGDRSPSSRRASRASITARGGKTRPRSLPKAGCSRPCTSSSARSCTGGRRRNGSKPGTRTRRCSDRRAPASGRSCRALPQSSMRAAGRSVEVPYMTRVWAARLKRTQKHERHARAAGHDLDHRPLRLRQIHAERDRREGIGRARLSLHRRRRRNGA